jgi:hypothetical protein
MTIVHIDKVTARRSLIGAALVLMASTEGIASQAAELPHRQPGLWESTLHLEAARHAPPRTRLCLDAETDALLYRYSLGLSKEQCSKVDVRGGGSDYTIDAICQVGTRRVVSHTVMTFEGNTAYRLVMQSHYEPPLHGRSDLRTEQEARWVSTCAPGQKPGDMTIDPPGIHMNVRDAIAKP